MDAVSYDVTMLLKYPRDIYFLIMDYLPCIEAAFLTLDLNLGLWQCHVNTSRELVQSRDGLDGQCPITSSSRYHRRPDNMNDTLTCVIMAGLITTLYESDMITYDSTFISLNLTNGDVSELNFILFAEMYPGWDLQCHIMSLTECHMYTALRYLIARHIKPELAVVLSVVAPILFLCYLPDDPTDFLSVVAWFILEYDLNEVLNTVCQTKDRDYTVMELLAMRYPVFALTYLHNPAYTPTTHLLEVTAGMLYCGDSTMFHGYVAVMSASYRRGVTTTQPVLSHLRYLIKYPHPYTDTLKQLLHELQEKAV